MKKKEPLLLPFSLGDGLRQEDITILYSDNTMEMLGENLSKAVHNTKHGLLIASSADDAVGVGNILTWAFDEILEVNRDGKGNLYVEVNTTEGRETCVIFDFITIW